ncbi:MAG: alpha-2-macroglobulin family protein [Treponema sp.]|nr:alpha-2-macroglobulin family protein [Treponema sp.]
MKKTDSNKSNSKSTKENTKKTDKALRKEQKAREKEQLKEKKKASKQPGKFKAGLKAFVKGLGTAFGTYNPPKWPKELCNKIKTEPKAKKSFKITMICLGSLAALVVFFFVGRFVVRFIKSKQPVDLKISCTIQAPEITVDLKGPLLITFKGSAAPLDMVNKPIVDGITITPEIHGNWVWDEGDTIIFTPIEDWQIGQEYKIKLDKKVLADHVQISERTDLSFKTTEFNVKIANSEYVIDDVNPKLKYISFELISNFDLAPDQDFASLLSVEPNIRARNGTVENRAYSVEAFMNPEETKKRVYIKSEPFGVPQDKIEVKLILKEGIKCLYGDTVTKKGDKATLSVNGSDSFGKIKSVYSSFLLDDNQEYNQVITIETTAKVSTDQLNSKLKIYALPKDRPQEPGVKAEEDFSWFTEAVSDTVIGKSKKLELKPYETETKYEKIHSYAIDVPENSYIYVRIQDGLEFYGDFYLAQTYATVIQERPYPKEISFASDGNIVSLNGSRRIPIMARGVKDVRLRIWRFKPDDLNHIVSQSNGDLKNFYFWDSSFNEQNTSEYILETKLKTNNRTSKSISYVDFDFSNYLGNIPSKDLRYGLFLVRLDNDECETVTKLVLVTDQTMIIKKASGGDMDVFVQSVSTGQPIASSRVDLVAVNGDVIASGYTDSNGHTYLPYSGRSYNRAVAITSTNGEDFTFLPYYMNGRYVDYSSFDVGGVWGSENPDTLNTYIFSDRSLYRPGEEITFGAIIKAGNWNKKINGTPLLYVITDPNGTEIAEKEFLLNSSGFEEIKYSTKEYSPTGSYEIHIYLRKMWENQKGYERIYLGSQSVKVEEFMPDTLQISTAFDPLSSDAWIHPKNLTAVVKLKNLFGNLAVGNKIKAQIELTPGYISLNKYKDYRFTDPFIAKQNYSQVFEETKTNSEGIAKFTLDMERFAPASYRLLFSAAGYEKESGRSVSSNSVLYVSPLDYLVGVKSDGDLNYISKDSARNLKFIAVGPNLDTVKVDNLKLSIVENRFVSVLVKQPNGIFKYQSVKKEYTLNEKTISIPKGGMDYALPVDTPGDYVVTITDKDGNEYSRTSFSVIGAKNVQRSLSRTAELNVVMNKSDFKNGETAELLIKAPYAGTGLICIERDRVYTYKWFTSSETSSVQTIQIPGGLEGNGYVTVMYTRDYNSSEIFMSPFCYAAVPFSISLENKTNKINIDVPDVVKPDTDYEIKYSSSKRGKIVIMAVDEGILQLAKHRTPDPLSFFFKKRALEVSTGQTNDLILPEYNILKTLAAAGGDAGYGEFLSANLNPFRKRQNASVAYWSGIIDTDSSVRTVKYHIPSYFNGKLRVMAVAVSDDSLGAAQAYTDVRDTYIIQPNCPNFAAPGDEFDVAVTVTNNDAGSGANAKVKLTAVTDKGLTLNGNATVELAIGEGKDATHIFTFKANEVLGNSDIKFTVQGTGGSSRYVSSLSVRPSVPYQVWINSGSVRKDKTSIDVNKPMYNEFATREVDLSYLPLGLANGLILYLDNYPYGCTEQVTSAAFPYLFPDLLKESGKAQKDAKAAVQNAVDVMQARQKPDGRIGYWTNNSNTYPILDCYCALFLTEAKEKGYYVPSSMFNRLLGALKEYAQAGDGHDSAFAIYVLTRNEIITTSYLENMEKKLKTRSTLPLEEIYMAASYKLLRMDKEAKKYAQKIKKDVTRVYETGPFHNKLYDDAVYLYLVSAHFGEYLSVIGDEFLSSIEQSMVERDYNSFSSSLTLCAIQSYIKAAPSSAKGKFTVTLDFGKDKAAKEMAVNGSKLLSGNFEGSAQKIQIENKDNLNLYYQVTQAGFLQNLPKEEINENGLEVTRAYSTSKNGKAQTSFTVGDEIYVTLRMRSLKGSSIDNVAIVEMLPSCFEVDYDSIRKNNDSNWKPDYVDIRDDRVVLYGKVEASAQSYTFKVKVITNGSFVVPPVFAQAMYENNVKALKPYEKIKVQKAK